MEHQAAVQLRASERYLLGELSPGEQDEFEDHYFTCPDCAEDVRAGIHFRANARAVFREGSGPAPQSAATQRGWLAWLRLRPALAASAALNVVLAAGVGIQVARVSRLTDATRPQFYPSFFVRAAYRSEATVYEVPRGARMVGPYFELKPEERQYPRYSYRVLDAGGRSVLIGVLETPATSSSELNMAIPTADLKRGVHTFIFSGVRNGQETELRRAQFRIQP